MELSSLAPARGSRKRKLRVGRGESSGHGKTCGRGGKGQSARKSGIVRSGFEGGQMPLIRRIPKLGFVTTQQIYGLNRFETINLSTLNSFKSGSTVDAESLVALGYGHKAARAGIKVLGSGELDKKLTVKVQAISESAKAKIEALGGTVELVKKAS